MRFRDFSNHLKFDSELKSKFLQDPVKTLVTSKVDDIPVEILQMISGGIQKEETQQRVVELALP